MDCPLTQYGFDPRYVPPYGTGANRVMIVGEAPGATEAERGVPFFPGADAGSVLSRAINKLGLTREQFVITNVVPWRPPNNHLEGARYEPEACSIGLSLLERTITQFRPRAILALGNIALRATTGLAGDKLSISYLAGFHLPSRWPDVSVIPCFHPSYLRQGHMSHMSVLLTALRKAIWVATSGRPPLIPNPDSPPPGYLTYPTEAIALSFLKEAESHKGFIAYDIETPYSTNESEAEEIEGDHPIRSVQFSLAPASGIFLPYREPFIRILDGILRLQNPKLSWNGWKYDEPILAANGHPLNGDSHDLMWAWHHSQPDLPRGLQFAGAQLGWPWPWKHLDSASPQFYGIVDVDILQWMAQ